MKRHHISAEAATAIERRDAAKIAQYRSLTRRLFEIRDGIPTSPYSPALLDEVTCLLTVNPEFYTAWNVRRSLLTQLSDSDASQYASLLHADLGFLLGLLRRFPKCYWIWLHRKWCLLQLVKLNQVDWQYEFDTIQKLLQLDSRNFHGWEYRRFVVGNIDGINAPASQRIGRCISEIEYTTSKINNNISNFSAWHNRSNLITQLNLLVRLSSAMNSDSTSDHDLQPSIPIQFSSPYQTLIHELELTKTGMYMDADDSLVWLYLQWLLTNKDFVESLRSGQSPQSYHSVLRQQLQDVEELNQLERDEHPQKLDHCWCLKTIVFLKDLLLHELHDQHQITCLNDEIIVHLRVLMQIDPLRRGKYMDLVTSYRSQKI